MPSWIVVFKSEGSMAGLLGPYTKYEAQRKVDKIEERCEVIDTIATDEVRAKREIKEQLCDVLGYQEGTKRIHSTKATSETY